MSYRRLWHQIIRGIPVSVEVYMHVHTVLKSGGNQYIAFVNVENARCTACFHLFRFYDSSNMETQRTIRDSHIFYIWWLCSSLEFFLHWTCVIVAAFLCWLLCTFGKKRGYSFKLESSVIPFNQGSFCQVWWNLT